MSIIGFFFPQSARASLGTITSRRIPYLVGMNIFLFLLYPMLGLTRVISEPEVYGIFMIALCVTGLFFIVSLGLVRSGRYLVASYLSSGTALLEVMWMGFLMPFHDPKDLYRVSSYLIAAITANAMVSMELRQIIAFFGADLAVFAAVLAFVAVPRMGGLTHELVSISIPLFLVIAAVNVVMLLITRLNQSLVSLAEEESEGSMKRAQRLRALLGGTKAALQTGKELVAVSEEGLRKGQEIRSRLAALKEKAAALADEAACADSGSSDTRARMQTARQAVESQNVVIVDTGASVERMAGTIASIAALAESKKETIAKVVALAERQGGEIRGLLGGIERVKSSGAAILKAAGGIMDISESTQLLAMNASIEAAHAGATGKGFAVIAGEIRKLSQQTQESTSRIAEAIKANDETVGSQAASIGRFTADMDRMVADVKEILAALGEILDGLGGVGSTTGGLSAATSSMLKLARQTQDSFIGAAEGLETGAASVAATKAFACGLEEGVDAMLEAFSALESAVGKAAAIGAENLDRVVELEAAIGSG